MQEFLSLPGEIIVFFTAMLPVIELRGAIPLALAHYQMAPLLALTLSLAGNILAAGIVLSALPLLVSFAEKRSPWLHKNLEKLFRVTRSKHTKRMNELGHIALITFVALPVPGSGAYTGALVAYLFGTPKHTSLVLISIGLLIAGLIVTFGVEGLINII